MDQNQQAQAVKAAAEKEAAEQKEAGDRYKAFLFGAGQHFADTIKQAGYAFPATTEARVEEFEKLAEIPAGNLGPGLVDNWVGTLQAQQGAA
jgi:hypothetical protein